MKLVPIAFSELSIYSLQPDLDVSARLSGGMRGFGVAGRDVNIELLLPHLDHLWKGASQVEGFPRPVTKIQS